MSDNIKCKSHDRAVTLIELILALALGALILASLTTVFRTGWQSWNEDNERSEFIQHARVAMWRITDDLRYAKSLDQLASGSSGNLQFTTKNLPDTGAIRVIRYEVADSELKRIEQGTSSKIAGSSSEGINVTALNSTPLKIDIDTGNLVALVGGDSPGDAIAVRVELTLQDADGDSFTVISTAKLRNKTAD